MDGGTDEYTEWVAAAERRAVTEEQMAAMEWRAVPEAHVEWRTVTKARMARGL